jgi:hypothetical protein
MKYMFILSVVLVMAFFGQTNVYGQEEELSVVLPADNASFSYPLSVIRIINDKCYGCHAPEAQGDKSKEALQWVKLQEMDDIDLLTSLDEILEVLEEGKMPPQKAIERYPNIKLTDGEVAKLTAWAQEMIAKLDE